MVSHTAISEAVIPLINENKIPTFLLAVSMSNITNQRDWVFKLHIGSDDEADIIVDFIRNKFPDMKSVALIYVNDAYGVDAANNFEQRFFGQIPVKESFINTQSDFKTIISKIKNSSAQGVYILGYTLAVPTLIKQMKEMNLNVPIFANVVVGSEAFIKAGGDAMNGVYLPVLATSFDNPPNETVRQFVDAYRETYNEMPYMHSAFAYVGVKMFEEAVKTKGDSNYLIRDGVLNLSDFNTAVGKVSVLSNRNVKFPLKIAQIINGGMVDVYNPVY